MERALIMFENIIALNPGDNQGVRSLIVDCYFRLKRPLDVLRTCDLYPGDGMEGLVYGRTLALFQLDRMVEAERELRDAASYLPLIAKELAKKRHPRPEELYPGYVTHGGADQAYSYWEDYGPFWKATPGALEWVRSFLAASD